MIKDLNKFIEKPISYQKDFLENCRIFEKISAFYFHVKIYSLNRLKFYKSNNKEIDMSDLILNKMWEKPINDFTEMFFTNSEFTKKSLGCTYSFFFFPNNNPLGVEYSGNYRYILDNIKLPNGQILNVGYVNEFKDIDSKHLIKERGICLNKNIRPVINKTEFNNILKQREPKVLEKFIIKNFINTDLISASKGLDNIEGFILKNNDDVFQIIKNPINKEVKDNRLALEIFTRSFIDFINQNNYTDCLISNNYISNVSSLTLKYKKWMEEENRMNIFTYYNILPEDLTAPTFGFYEGTYFDLIPNNNLREICKAIPLWDNIFKILLNGLRKKKKFIKESFLMTEKDIEIWNELVEIFSMYSDVFKKIKLKIK